MAVLLPGALDLCIKLNCPIYSIRLHINSICRVIISNLYSNEALQKGYKMTLRDYIIAGIIEQVIMLAFITPATGWWFSFFGLTAVWNLVAGVFRK